MPSCVVVATTEESDAIAAETLQSGATHVDQDHQVGDRVVLTCWFDDDTAAAATVRDLRGRGVVACPGPGSANARRAWATHTAPVRFGQDCCVCFPWSIFDRTAFREVTEIDPGGGFGAGRHPTTRLVLESLDPVLDEQRFLDIGCGSGVLSVVAARRGATVTAVDISAEAVSATRVNARLNGVTEKVGASAKPVEDIEDRFENVVANIHAEVLAAMAPELARLCVPGGKLTISGFSTAQVSKLLGCLGGFNTVARHELDGWVAFVLTPTAV